MLLPRLSGPAADAALEAFLAAPTSWPGFELPDAVRYAPTGGSRVTADDLHALRAGLTELAGKHGPGAGRAETASFDAEAASWLSTHPLLQCGDAARDDVWTFMGIALCPDVTYWRFGTKPERYYGGVRNTFQRLWMRGKALDRGQTSSDRWQLLYLLTEDALVQITERPSIGADPKVARALAEAWVRASTQIARAGMEDLMRRAALRVRAWNEVRVLGALPEDQLAEVMDTAFETRELRARMKPPEFVTPAA